MGMVTYVRRTVEWGVYQPRREGAENTPQSGGATVERLTKQLPPASLDTSCRSTFLHDLLANRKDY